MVVDLPQVFECLLYTYTLNLSYECTPGTNYVLFKYGYSYVNDRIRNISIFIVLIERTNGRVN